MPALLRHHLVEALDATGVGWRFGLSPRHWNVLPASDVRPWARAEESALMAAARSVGGRVTRDLVRPDCTSLEARPGKGFRVYAGTGPDTLTRDPRAVLVGPAPDLDREGLARLGEAVAARGGEVLIRADGGGWDLWPLPSLSRDEALARHAEAVDRVLAAGAVLACSPHGPGCSPHRPG